MQVNPLVVAELRSLFKKGSTPTAIIRRIAERHEGDPLLDALVRGYFREAFCLSTVHIGPDQVRRIAEGGSFPIVNAALIHRMLRTREQWDQTEGQSADCWLNAVVASEEASAIAVADLNSIPELAGSWDRMDDEAKQFIRRIIGNSRTLLEKVTALAALAEQLQQQNRVKSAAIAA